MGVVIKSDKEFEKFFRENFPAVQAFMRRYTGDDGGRFGTGGIHAGV